MLRLLVITAILAVLTQAATYDVQLVYHSAEPVVSSINQKGSGYSPCKYTYNPAFLPASETVKKPCMFTRVSECPPHLGGIEDHIMLIPHCDVETGLCSDLDESFIFPAKGAEDPRIVFDSETGVYHHFFYYPGTDKECTDPDVCTVGYSWSKTPLDVSSWSMPIKRLPWHRNGCVILPKSGDVSYILYGEGPPPLPGIGLATTTDFKTFRTINESLLTPLGTSQGEVKLEAGTPPVLLNGGDYIHFYAAATPTWDPPLRGNYTIGYAVLSGINPNNVIERGTALITPSQHYERGDLPWPNLRHGAIFLQTAVKMKDKHGDSGEYFRIWFGGGDAVIGTGIIRVEKK